MRRGILILGALALALVAAACTSDRETPKVTTPTATTTPSAPTATTTPSAPAATTVPSAPTATPTPSAPTATAQPTPQPARPAAEVAASVSPAGAEVKVDVEIPPPEGIFAQSAAALAGLKSYLYTTTFSFVREDDGKPESGSVEVRGAVAGPDRQRMTWRDLETGEEFGLLRVGDRAWILDGAEWTAVPTLVADAAAQAVLVYAPSASWGAFADGMGETSSYVGTEVVSGIRARHYRSTYRGWAEQWEGEITDASADVWIAEAGYPVRYHFKASGVDEDGNHGSMSWTMELSDVNGPVSIDAPQ